MAIARYLAFFVIMMSGSTAAILSGNYIYMVGAIIAMIIVCGFLLR